MRFYWSELYNFNRLLVGLMYAKIDKNVQLLITRMNLHPVVGQNNFVMTWTWESHKPKNTHLDSYKEEHITFFYSETLFSYSIF